MKIKLQNLNRLYQELQPVLDNVVKDVYKSGQHLLGPYTTEFEERIANVSGARYAAVVGSGSDALYYALVSENILGDVVMPAQTYIATANSILRAGCTPVGIDVSNRGLLRWDLIPPNINVAVWVGLFGNIEELPADILLIEDGAQHFGAPLQGNTASYSFDPTKNLPNFGNGGAVVSNDKTVIENVKALRRHYTVNGHPGGNSIMSERECAEMCVKLDHFPFWTERRQEIARDYSAQLSECVDCITQTTGQVSKFVINTPYRKELAEHLTYRKIETKRAYEKSLADVEQATWNCQQFLQIPCNPHMTDEEVLEVILAIKEFFKERPLKSLH
jgi:dTDP-4-amino-4,6-dideoxygalactose transaminase